MSQIKAVFDGAVVAEPEYFTTNSGADGVNIAVYVNRQRKNRDTGVYEDTGDVSKIRVTLWGELAETKILKGDIVEVDATLYERAYEGKNGPGRSLETDWVNSIVVKHRKDTNAKAKVSAGAASSAGWSGDSDPVW